MRSVSGAPGGALGHFAADAQSVAAQQPVAQKFIWVDGLVADSRALDTDTRRLVNQTFEQSALRGFERG